MTFVEGARIAETSQCRRMVFIIIRKDELSAAARTCSMRGCYCAEQMADWQTTITQNQL